MPWPEAVLIALGAAVLLFRAGVVGLGGAGLGAVLVVFLELRGGYAVLAAVILLVVGGELGSRWRRERKRRMIASVEEKRGAAHALANVGPALLLLWLLPLPGARIAALAALAAAFSDTMASELGLGFGQTPRMLLFGRPVAAGSDGAMSFAGTSCGALAALLAGGVAQLFSGDAIWWCVAVGGISGNFVDSFLGWSIERRLPSAWANHLVNALASTSGGLGAWALGQAFAKGGVGQ